MNRRHLRMKYRRYLATYTLDSLPRPKSASPQFVSCHLEFDGERLQPVLGQPYYAMPKPGLGFKRVTSASLQESGLIELVALLHLTRSGGFQLATAMVN